MGKAIVTRNGDALEINISALKGSEFGDAKEKIRAIPGRNFDWDTKLWRVPAEPETMQQLMWTIQPEASQELIDWMREGLVQSQQDLTTPLPEDAKLLLPWATQRAKHQPEAVRVGEELQPFNGLLQHQRPAVDLIASKRKAIEADDMGLGKSGIALSAVEEWALREVEKGLPRPEGPRLVIAPNSVKGSWLRQFKMWLGNDGAFQIIDGNSAKARHEQLASVVDQDAWVVVNWEQIRTHKVKKIIKRRNGSESKKVVEEMKEPLFETTDWLAVIADEAHRAKNRKAFTTRGLWRTRADDGVMLAMSGTPLMNSPDELWSILAWLWPHDYHERGAKFSPGARAYWSFYEEYVEYTEGYHGRQITGVRNADTLRFELSGRLIRRTQGQVLDLPGKHRIPVPVTLNPKQRKLYTEAEKQMWLEIEKAVEAGDAGAKRLVAETKGDLSKMLKLPNGAARTVRLRQIIESPALLEGEDDSAVLDACVEHIMDSRPEPWVVFTAFKGTPDLLVKRLAKRGLTAVPYTGDVDPEDRSKIEDQFQAGQIDVVVGTIASMYQGITLTAANRQFWCSRDFVPDINEQGEDRCNRIGQSKRVAIYIAEAEDTVATTKVAPINKIKERIVRSVVSKDHIEQEVSA